MGYYFRKFDILIYILRGKQSMPFNLERLKRNDIPDLIALSQSVGWDYDREELEMTFSSGIIFGHKNKDGQVISSAAVIPYGQILASIGLVIVHREYRGAGLGKSVTKACINAVSSQVPLMLIATQEGQPMYESLGFKKVSSVHKFMCDQFISTYDTLRENLYEIKPYSSNDFAHIVKLDENAVGANRSDFLKVRIHQSKECFIVKDLTGHTLGFGMSIQTPQNLILGPLVAPHDYIAELLVCKLAEGYQGKLRVDVPTGKKEFMDFLIKHGFKEINQPPIMILHANHLPPRNGHLYGIASQAFG